MKLLVVGINGFLGREIAREALSRGWTVDGIVHVNQGGVPPGVRRLCTLSSIEPSICEAEIVIVASAFIPYGALNTPDDRLLEVNRDIVKTVSGLFPGAKLVYTSSASVYGTPQGTLKEDSPCVSPGLYGQSKLAGEEVTKNHRQFSIVRYSSLYGEGMNLSTVIPRFLRQAKEQKFIEVWGDGGREQDYLHVRDAAKMALLGGLHAANEILLGVSGVSLSNLYVANAIAEAVPGTQVRLTGTDDNPSWRFDPSKSHRVLSFVPQRDFKREMELLAHG